MTKSIRAVDVEQQWWVVDAAGQTLGRVAAQVATLLRSKHKPYYTPHVDCGDFVVVINAGDVQLQGKRAEQKEYFRYTGYPGGGRTVSFKDAVAHKPDFVIEHAVKGMLPKNRLGREISKKLKVYAGSEHPHEAQQPKTFELKYS
ncbi:MAG TPA: 50S ribosomal protein L13 [Patescibacteria group bacterium]|nr:50S ribosomal protein L13 [Patescibacteria group bacterium]